jgi:hypothetical protein
MMGRILMIPLALIVVGAALPAKYIPLGKYDEGLVIPAGSPVSFERFGQYDRARFRGKFTVEGIFVVDCDYCEPGYKDNELHLSVVPDPSTAARLPHWKVHDNDIKIDITNAGPFILLITTPDERQRLLSGKLDEIRGRAALVVDQYEAGLDCDSANYSARFVAVAKAPTLANVEPKGDFGCG